MLINLTHSALPINSPIFFFFKSAFYQRPQKARGKLQNKPEHTHSVQQGYAEAATPAQQQTQFKFYSKY